MANRIEFVGDMTTDGLMLQWKGHNVGHEALAAASTHDYMILFDGDNNLVSEEKFTRPDDRLEPGEEYEAFTYIQLPEGDYTGYLTLDQDGDDDTVADRQREFRLQVVEGRAIVY